MNRKGVGADYYKDWFVCEVIEEFGLGFHLGNALKYVLRAGKKHNKVKQDYQKALDYIERFQFKGYKQEYQILDRYISLYSECVQKFNLDKRQSTIVSCILGVVECDACDLQTAVVILRRLVEDEN